MSEILDIGTEQKINQQIFETAQRLFDQLEKELNNPDTRKLYLTGERDLTVRVFADPLLEAIALRIIEKETLIKCTLEEDTINHLTEELFFYVDLFYSVVTTILDIAEIRRNDISNSTHLLFLFATMEVLMSEMTTIAELENLRELLRKRCAEYPEKPELQKRIRLLVPQSPSQSSVYSVTPPIALHEYTNGQILASLNVAGLNATGVAGLPAGIILNEATGDLKVQDASQLTKGSYTLFIKTTDHENGSTDHEVKLSVGVNRPAVYTVYPPKKIDEYTNGAVLASVTDSDGDIVSAKTVSGNGNAELSLPQGVSLNAINGEITVANREKLLPGDYYAAISTTDINGYETLHTLLFSFETDHEAIYSVKPANAINEYRKDQILASVTDVDGGISSALLTGLPDGVTMDPATGDILVSDAMLLKEGTFQFNILTTDATGIQKINSVSLTIGNNVSVYFYTITDSKKIQNYFNGDVLAELNEQNPSIEIIEILSGKLPDGTSLNTTNGKITVTDHSLLKAGTYEVKIILKPTNNETKIHDLFLEIEPDYKAVYRVAYGKDTDDYVVDEIIAEVIDIDGIISAEVLVGSVLPAGTQLNNTTGEIYISNPALLEAGKHVVFIRTTDILNGITDSRIAIYFTGADNESQYTVLPPKAIDGYKNDELIAYVTDLDLGVVKAEIYKGGLPQGTLLNTSNGDITISDKTKLLPGFFDGIYIKTTDGVGRTSINTISLKFLDDIEISYTLFEPRVVTSYKTGEPLFILNVAEGIVKSAVLFEGKLPTGTKLNSTTGTITAYSPDDLLPGIFPVGLLVTDKNGGETKLNFEIILLEDFPAKWRVIKPTQIDQLTNHTRIAHPIDPNGAIVRARIITGDVPGGTDMDKISGVIRVTNSSLLKAGFYKLEIETKDVVGGITTAQIEITLLNTDSEAIYTINPPRNVDAYEVDDILAFATDPDGTIVSSEILSGDLPPGTTLESDGTIKVTDLTSFQAGVYTVVIETTDAATFITESTLIMEILPDNEAEYTILQKPNYDNIINGTLLAHVSDPDASILSAVLIGGTLPIGTTLYEDEATAGAAGKNVGDIVVTDVTHVVPGIYTGIRIRTTDETGGKTDFSLTLEIAPDNDAVFTVQFPRDLHSYRNGDEIVRPFDFDGAITSATLLSGSLHSGTGINTINGVISVITRTSLVGGFKNPKIETTDATGGITQEIIGIELKTLPNRKDRSIYNSFITRFRERLDEFEVLFEDRLAPEFTQNRDFLDDSITAANTIKSDLENSTIEAQYWSGSKEDFIKTTFLALSDPVKDGILDSAAIISGGGTPEEIADAQRDLLFRTALYGEIFESMLDITAYRRADIPASSSNPIQTMFDELDLQLNEVRTMPEISFIFENITVIITGITGSNPPKTRLINRMTDLLT